MSSSNSDPTEWQVAPAGFEIANYDKPKIDYRRKVENFIKPISLKSLRKKSFITIATNVLCADIDTSKESIDPADRDIYLPLEIALTKWSLSEAKKLKADERVFKSSVWMINPGKPTRNSVCASRDQQAKHKITFDLEDPDQNPYITTDLNQVMKEINSTLLPDRTVFSLSLQHCRQDLGCLKWLNRATGYKTRPISVYSLEDLYVVLMRHIKPELKKTVGLGLAHFRMEDCCDGYDTKLHCNYHEALAKEEDGDCKYCALNLSISHTNLLLDDITSFTSLFNDQEKPETTDASTSTTG